MIVVVLIITQTQTHSYTYTYIHINTYAYHIHIQQSTKRDKIQFPREVSDVWEIGVAYHSPAGPAPATGADATGADATSEGRRSIGIFASVVLTGGLTLSEEPEK